LDENELDVLSEEFGYWKSMEDRAINPEAKKKAAYFVNIYK
jgi:hypothetical protein